MAFEIEKCRKCGAERWIHNLEGQLVLDKKEISVDQIHHVISLCDFIRSYGFKNGEKVKISIERLEK